MLRIKARQEPVCQEDMLAEGGHADKTGLAYNDVVVGHELQNGSLVKAHSLSLPGYSFYVVWMQHHPRSAVMESFLAWMRAVL